MRTMRVVYWEVLTRDDSNHIFLHHLFDLDENTYCRLVDEMGRASY